MFSPSNTGNPLTWTVADVGKWLVSINMSNHCAAFATNEIDGSCLKLMDDETLAEIGVSLSIHRKNLLERIKQLFAPQGSFLHTHLNRNLTFFHSQAPPLPQPVPTALSLLLSYASQLTALFVVYTDDADYPHDLSIYN